MKNITDILALVVVAGIIAVLARNPTIVTNFFSGSSKLLGTALSSGQKGK